MLCLVRYLFVISTSVIDCLGRFVPKMTYYVSSGMLNLAQLNWMVGSGEGNVVEGQPNNLDRLASCFTNTKHLN